MLKGKKILLGITGSIAAYKAILLIRLLVKAGAEVRVVITPAAKEFVSTLTISTLSKNKVLYNVSDEDTWTNHVMLGRWADLMLIAPLSCNTLSKMAYGLCDNLLLAVYLSATCPVVVAPAMDEDMWHHPATQKNIETIKGYGNKIITVHKGELASGLFGDGRMAEPEEIINFIIENYFRTTDLKGKKILISAGPTVEAIDPVRFISNHSTGKMGYALAIELYLRGAEVELVSGPTAISLPYKGIKLKKVISADEMYTACNKAFATTDIAIMCAAVADYTPIEKASEKIKKNNNNLQLNLVKTKDILQSLGSTKTSNQLLIGFALETTNEKQFALEKLKTKNADLIVLNSLQNKDAGFGVDTNKVTIFDQEGNEFDFETDTKQKIASNIVDLIINKFYV